jgi:hypothetical protein
MRVPKNLLLLLGVVDKRRKRIEIIDTNKGAITWRID